MKLKESNIWLVLSLLVTTIVGPVIVWNLQQGKIEALKVELEREDLALKKNQQLVEMYARLGKLLTTQREYYDAYTELAQKGHSAGSFELQRKRLQMSEKYEEIEETKKIISELTGKTLDDIRGRLPPLPPTGLKIQ